MYKRIDDILKFIVNNLLNVTVTVATQALFQNIRNEAKHFLWIFLCTAQMLFVQL